MNKILSSRIHCSVIVVSIVCYRSFALHNLVPEPNNLPDNMPRGRRRVGVGRAQRMDPIADVYERDRVADLQRQVDALTAQLAAVHR